jgi:hypothetical protein
VVVVVSLVDVVLVVARVVEVDARRVVVLVDVLDVGVVVVRRRRDVVVVGRDVVVDVGTGRVVVGCLVVDEIVVVAARVVVVLVGVGHSSMGRGRHTSLIASRSTRGLVPSGARASNRTFIVPARMPSAVVGTAMLTASLHERESKLFGRRISAARGPRRTSESSPAGGMQAPTRGSLWFRQRRTRTSQTASPQGPESHGSPSAQTTRRFARTCIVPASMPPTSSSA